MNKILTVKTDASYKSSVGITVAYYATLKEHGNIAHEFSDSKFIDKNLNSTDAEVIGVAYGIVQSHKNMGGKVNNCKLRLRSDCNYAVDEYQNLQYTDRNDLYNVLKHFLRNFGGWEIKPISRNNNVKADSLAGEELRRAEDRQ